MARVGITEQQVVDAAEALLQEGQSVTVSSVRERIGSGSYSTINAHLSKWREANDNRKPADVPEIPPSVDNALRHVWALAWKEAQERIKTEREGLDAARREMEREKTLMEKEIAELDKQLTEQTQAIVQVRESLAQKVDAFQQLEAENRTLSIDNARYEERAKAADERTESLRGELDNLHERLRELAIAGSKASAPAGRRKTQTKKDE